MSATSSIARHNKLLSHLPKAECERFVANCEAVELPFGQVLATRGTALSHAYFPTDCFVSLIATVEGGDLEVGMAGSEGMVGISLGLGIEDSGVRAMVQGPGRALRMDAGAFRTELDKSPSLRRQIGRYAHIVMSQFAQTAGCNRYHVVEQRLARWLLMTADRAHAEHFDITHEFLATMLGVRRVGVTNSAGELQSQELIRYARGHLRILDRKGLERVACSCYKADLALYDRAWN
ncbi:MAG TPA: Crp/Fnr family transcriptional regulator [Usitatibacter sp.]|nr:Crp/Fnr family transcriptional regulator [Usitatibacter sp.]